MRPILILTADVGAGHRRAAEALQRALDGEGGGGSAVIEDVLDDPRVPGLLRGTDDRYEEVLQRHPRLYELGFRATDGPLPVSAIEALLARELEEPVGALLERHAPSLVAVTHPAPLAALTRLRERGRLDVPVATVVTDFATVHRLWLHPGVDRLVVPTGEVVQRAVEAGVDRGRVRVIGIPVDPAVVAPRGEPAAIRREHGWTPDVPTLLVVASPRRRAAVAEVAERLDEDVASPQLLLVAAGDEELHAAWRARRWRAPAHVFGYVEDMGPLLQACDAVVCKAGGLIVAEALACGRPLILVDVLPGQERGNAEHVERLGAGRVATTPREVGGVLVRWLADGGAGLHGAGRAAAAAGRPWAAGEIARELRALADGGAGQTST